MFDWNFTRTEALRYIAVMAYAVVDLLAGIALFGPHPSDVATAFLVLLAPIDIVISGQIAASRVDFSHPTPGYAAEPPTLTLLRFGLLTNALMFGLGIPAALRTMRRTRH